MEGICYKGNFITKNVLENFSESNDIDHLMAKNVLL